LAYGHQVPVRLIATDLDGTFFGPDHLPEARTITALNAVQAAGIVCVAISGRGHRDGLTRVTSNGAEFDWFIGSNGGHRLNIRSGEMEEHLVFNETDIIEFRRRLSDHDPDLAFGWTTAEDHYWEQPFLDIHPMKLDGRFRAGSHRIVDTAPPGVDKAFVAHPELLNVELLTHVEPHVDPRHHVTTSGVDFVEMTPNGADKGAALARLCSRLDIVAEEVIAFGDNYNDLTMLEWAGRGVAMGNALDRVKETADEVTYSNVEFGVARVLEELV
jgi:Cof subfamily protein (haloacid dehalogenase superfamily)